MRGKQEESVLHFPPTPSPRTHFQLYQNGDPDALVGIVGATRDV